MYIPLAVRTHSEKRPDILIELGGSTWLLDVTVRHSLAPSNLKDSSVRKRKCLETAESEKHNTYNNLAESVGATLVAFAVESTGGLGAEAQKFVKSIIALSARVRAVWAPHDVVHGLYRTVAIGVARGNARIIANALKDAQRRGVK